MSAITKFLLLLIVLCGCATHRKPCQVERICFTYRNAMLAALSTNTIVLETDQEASLRRVMMTDILRTMAALEQEAGGYQ